MLLFMSNRSPPSPSTHPFGSQTGTIGLSKRLHTVSLEDNLFTFIEVPHIKKEYDSYDFKKDWEYNKEYEMKKSSLIAKT